MYRNTRGQFGVSNRKALVKIFEIEAFIISFIFSIASAVISMLAIGCVGVFPDTAIIGALIAIAIAMHLINSTQDSNRYAFAQARMGVLP